MVIHDLQQHVVCVNQQLPGGVFANHIGALTASILVVDFPTEGFRQNPTISLIDRASARHYGAEMRNRKIQPPGKTGEALGGIHIGHQIVPWGFNHPLQVGAAAGLIHSEGVEGGHAG